MAHAYCAVIRCPSSSRKHKEIKFHKFPRDPKRRESWIEACRRPELKSKTVDQLCNMHVCGLHFEGYMYGKHQLKDTAIPTINLPPSSTYSVSTQTQPWSEIQQEAKEFEKLYMKIKQELADEAEMRSEYVTEHDPCVPSPKRIKREDSINHEITEIEIKREVEINELEDGNVHVTIEQVLEDGNHHVTIEQFLQGCDLYLSPELSQFVKTQIKRPV